MRDELKIKQNTMRLQKGDITDLEVEAFVYYARPDLILGSGYGGAISLRGGPKIQEDLKKFGTIGTGEAVVTSAGNMKAKYIIHAVGPRFQEENTEEMLRTTTLSILQRAEENKIQTLAFPAMGVGFYGVPVEVCAKIVLGTVKEYLENPTALREVVFCLRDSREYASFQERLKEIS